MENNCVSEEYKVRREGFRDFYLTLFNWLSKGLVESNKSHLLEKFESDFKNFMEQEEIEFQEAGGKYNIYSIAFRVGYKNAFARILIKLYEELNIKSSELQPPIPEGMIQ